MRRAVALCRPREHGSWSLVAEPLAFGLIAAPSWPGAALGAGVVAAFFIRRPLRLLLADPSDPRQPIARASIAVLGLVAVAGLLVAAALGGIDRLWPLLFAMPLGAGFLALDARGESRQAVAELTGATALAFLPAALASVAGARAPEALAMSAVMAARSVPAVMTVRAFLRRQKGEAVSVWPALAMSAVAVAAAAVLCRAGLAPAIAVAAMVILCARAWVLLGFGLVRMRATRLGIAESALGGLLVAAWALGWKI